MVADRGDDVEDGPAGLGGVLLLLKQPLVVGTVDDAVAVMAVVDAARASAAHAGEWNPIPEEAGEWSQSFSSTR